MVSGVSCTSATVCPASGEACNRAASIGRAETYLPRPRMRVRQGSAGKAGIPNTRQRVPKRRGYWRNYSST
jgi:hypothetical protein